MYVYVRICAYAYTHKHTYTYVYVTANKRYRLNRDIHASDVKLTFGPGLATQVGHELDVFLDCVRCSPFEFKQQT